MLLTCCRHSFQYTLMRLTLLTILTLFTMQPLQAQPLVIAGSTTMTIHCIYGNPHVSDADMEALDVSFVPTNSGSGLLALASGEADIAMISTDLNLLLQKLPGNIPSHEFRLHPVSTAHIDFIVHPDLSVDKISAKQLKNVFNGRTGNWKELGGPDLPIQVYSEQPTGGMYQLIKKNLLQSDNFCPTTEHAMNAPQIVFQVAKTPGAMGFISSQTPTSLTSKAKYIEITDLPLIEQKLFFVTRSETTSPRQLETLEKVIQLCQIHDHEAPPKTDTEITESVATGQDISAPPAVVQPMAAPDKLYVAMTAAFVSQNGAKVYEEISDYISDHLGIDTVFIQNLSYRAVNNMLKAGQIHVGFICSLPYVELHDEKNSQIELLAAPVPAYDGYNNRPVYYAYIITHKDAPMQSFEALQGHSFVFNDTLSNSGYNMPRHALIERGFTDHYFSQVSQSGSHEESIRMVAEGLVDASSVDSLVLDYALANHEAYADQVKIIERLGPAGVPPVVYAKTLPSNLVTQLKSTFYNMHQDTQGRKILEQAGLSSFVPVPDTHYDSIRTMKKAAVDSGFTTIP